MMMSADQFRLYPVQMSKVYLKSIEYDGGALEQMNPTKTLGVALAAERELQSDDNLTSPVLMALTAEVICTETGFRLKVSYMGELQATDLPEPELMEQFIEVQAVRLLLPYIRETVSGIMSRSGVVPYLFPTIDVLKSVSIGGTEEKDGE